jgi:hypothetical protein
MTQQMGYPAAASHPIVAFIWPYALGLNDFQALMAYFPVLFETKW